MFKDLRTSTKLIVLCAMFMIAIGVTTYSLLREKLMAIEFAQKELIGTKYLASLRRLYTTATQPFDGSVTSYSDSFRDILKDLASAQADAVGTLQTEKPEQELAASLQSSLSKIENGTANILAPDVLAKAQTLAARIADDSNLTLDPDLDSFYVQDIVDRTLPAFLRQLGELESVARQTTVTKTLSLERTERIKYVAGALRSISDEVGDDTAAAYRGNGDGSLKQSIDKAFATMSSRTEAYLRDLNASLPVGDVPFNAIAANGSYDRAVESAVGAFAAALLELDRLLQSRIDRLSEKMRWSLALTGALSALSILVAVLTYRHVVRPLKRLEGVASSVGESKDYSLRIDYSSKNEIGRLVSAFNTMLAELAAAHERERSEQSELARATRLTTMGAMTASIAHEINQPLAAIVANSNAAQRWLSRAPPDLDEVRVALKNIVKDGHRASDVIGSIRAIFKRDSRAKDRLDVNDVIVDVLALVGPEIRKQQILLARELHPDLPQTIGDRTQLQQVFMNLAMNAIESMTKVTNRERLLLVKSYVRDVGNIEITIEDSGSGIDPFEKDRIFDAFYTTKSEGMGMGLFICRSIIEAHGGRLWASPGAHCGSVFHVVLPSIQ